MVLKRFKDPVLFRPSERKAKRVQDAKNDEERRKFAIEKAKVDLYNSRVTEYKAILSRGGNVERLNQLRGLLGLSTNIRYDRSRGYHTRVRRITGMGTGYYIYTSLSSGKVTTQTIGSRGGGTDFDRGGISIVPQKRYVDKVGVVRREGKTGFSTADYNLAQARGVKSRGILTLKGIRREVPSEIKPTQGFKLQDNVFTIGTALRLLGKKTLNEGKTKLLTNSKGMVIGVEDPFKKQSYALATPITKTKAERIFKEKQLGKEFRVAQTTKAKAKERALKKDVKVWTRMGNTFDKITARSTNSRVAREKVRKSIDKVLTKLEKYNLKTKTGGAKSNAWVNKFISEVATLPYDFTIGLGRFVPEFFEKVGFQIAVMIQGDFKKTAWQEIDKSIRGSPLAVAKSFDPRTPEGLANLVVTSAFIKLSGVRKVGKVQAVKSIPKVSNFKIGTFLKSPKGVVRIVGKAGKVFKLPKAVRNVIKKVKVKALDRKQSSLITPAKAKLKSLKKVAKAEKRLGKVAKKFEKAPTKGKVAKKTTKKALSDAKARVKERGMPLDNAKKRLKLDKEVTKAVKQNAKMIEKKLFSELKARLKTKAFVDKMQGAIKNARKKKLFLEAKARLKKTGMPLDNAKKRLQLDRAVAKAVKQNAKMVQKKLLSELKARIKTKKFIDSNTKAIMKSAKKKLFLEAKARLKKTGMPLDNAKKRLIIDKAVAKAVKQNAKMIEKKLFSELKARLKTKAFVDRNQKAILRARKKTAFREAKARLKETGMPLDNAKKRLIIDKAVAKAVKQNAKLVQKKLFSELKARIKTKKFVDSKKKAILKAVKKKAFLEAKARLKKTGMPLDNAKKRLALDREVTKSIKKNAKMIEKKLFSELKARIKTKKFVDRNRKAIARAKKQKAFLEAKARLKRTGLPSDKAKARIKKELLRVKMGKKLKKELVAKSLIDKKIQKLTSSIKDNKLLLSKKKLPSIEVTKIKKRIQTATDILKKTKSKAKGIETKVTTGKAKSKSGSSGQKQSTQQVLKSKTAKAPTGKLPKLNIINAISVSTGIVAGSKIRFKLGDSLIKLPATSQLNTQGEANILRDKLGDILKDANKLKQDEVVIQSQANTNKQKQLLKQELKLVEKLIQKTKTKLRQASKKIAKGIKLPKIPNWNTRLPKGEVLVVNPIVRVKGRNVELKWKTTPNRARKRIEGAVDNTTARSYSLKIVGVKKGKDLKALKSKKFRRRVGSNKQVQINVERSKYAIDTKGEKKGLKISKLLKPVKPKGKRTRAKAKPKPSTKRRKPTKRRVTKSRRTSKRKSKR